MRGRHRASRLPRLIDTPFKRRTLLAGGFAGGVTLGVAGWALEATRANPLIPKAESDEPEPPPPPAKAGPPGPHLQIIAHPDDDLYFYNLDTQRGIADGHDVVTVCLTTGEANGRNGDSTLPSDFAGYAAARQIGQRAAYADMIGQDPAIAWEREAVTFDEGITAEVATLNGVPKLTMIYLNLWEDSSKQEGSSGARLMDLWNGTSSQHHTLVPSGSPVTQTSVYTRQVLLATLTRILDDYQPSLVRTLDPDPDAQVHDETTKRHADQPGFSDHADHTAAGLFGGAALVAHRFTETALGPMAEAYRGYYNRRWPRNLSAEAVTEKGRYLDVYSWKDQRECDVAAGCGDLRVKGSGAGSSYGPSTIHRYTPDTNWLRIDSTGRLFAMSVHAGRSVRWSQRDESESAWRRDIAAADPWLLPTIHLAETGGGEQLALALSAEYAATADGQVRDLLVRAVSADIEAEQWQNLGNPDAEAADPVNRRGIGVPVVVALDDGRLVCAVRGFSRQPAIRIRDTDGTWSDWRQLDGAIIQDGLSAVAGPDGGCELFGSGAESLSSWYFDGKDWSTTVFETVVPASAPTAVSSPDDAATLLVVREADTAQIMVYRRESGDQSWDTVWAAGGNGGIGPVAAIAPPKWEGKLAMAAGDDAGKVAMAIMDTATGEFVTEWSAGGPVLAHAPALTVDETGRLVAAAINTNGELFMATQEEPGVGVPSEWFIAGESH